jgi:Plasma-membrane choline transporter
MQYDSATPNYLYLTYFAYVLWTLSGVTVILGYFHWNSVKLAIKLFTKTRMYILHNFRIFLIPTIALLVSFVLFVGWIVAGIWMYSVGSPAPQAGTISATEIKWD